MRLDGRGEHFQAALSPMKGAMVLVKPQTGLSTAAVYRKFDENPSLPSEDIEQAANETTSAQDVPLFNGLDVPARALLSDLDQVFSWAEGQEGVKQAILCGSGSSVALFATSFEEACKLSAAAMAQGWWARATALANLRAAVVPR